MAKTLKNPTASEMGRKGGRSRSPKKLAAVAKNAQLGGRKPKFAIGDRVRVKDAATSVYRGHAGIIAELAGRARYDVKLDSSGAVVPLYSWWLEAE